MSKSQTRSGRKVELVLLQPCTWSLVSTEKGKGAEVFCGTI